MAVISRDVPKCPLCGAPAVLVDCDFEGEKLYTVMCTNPEQCGLGSGFHHSDKSALEAWEKRKDYAEKVKAERRERA